MFVDTKNSLPRNTLRNQLLQMFLHIY